MSTTTLFFFYLTLLQSIHTAIQRLPSISLNEQSSIGTSIYDLSRVYSSPSKNRTQFTFLSDSSPHNSFFIVDSLTGRISIKRMIDREELCQTHTCQCERCLLTLELIASSQTIDILSLDILIENINDNQPTFPISSFTIRLTENIDIGHTALFPAATDLDYQDRLEYRLIPLNESDRDELLQTFAIINLQTENQLGLSLLKSLDREKRNTYRMKILATDGEHTGELLLDVQILDSNDNVPQFEHEKYHIELPEDTSIGTEFLHIRAFDRDEGLNSLINYTLIRDNPSSAYPFSIDIRTGMVKLIERLDYEYETNYHFNIRARDNGPDAISVYTQVQIDVLDVNDCPPDIDFIFPDSHTMKNIYYLEEEKDNQTRLFHLSVSDKDSINQKILLQLSTYTHLFQLNEQFHDLYNLVVIGRLDREEQEEYQLIFQASDSSLTTEKQLTIRLIDINDSPPILDPFPTPITINENNPPNIRLIQFHARDLDAPNTSNSLLSYSLLPSNESRYFHIDCQTGIFSVRNISFDYESKSMYHVILNISDHGSNPQRLTTLQSLTIHINNLNDNPPKFERDHYVFQIAENVPIGTLIGQVQAIDFDVNSMIYYELNTTDDDEDRFHIDSLTGQLSSKTLLDYETRSIYHLYVIARDNNDLHWDHVFVTIELLDINDHIPIIQSPSTVFIPSELLENNHSKSMIITTINAKDRDSGMNGNLTYRISEGNPHDYFQINVHNGTISAERKNLLQGHHRLTIKVCDQGEIVAQCSLTSLDIQIGNRKDSIEETHILTNQIILVIIISSIFTLAFSVTMGILCAVCCKEKRYRHIHRSSLNKPCELLQATDADKLLSSSKVSFPCE